MQHGKLNVKKPIYLLKHLLEIFFFTFSSAIRFSDRLKLPLDWTSNKRDFPGDRYSYFYNGSYGIVWNKNLWLFYGNFVGNRKSCASPFWKYFSMASGPTRLFCGPLGGHMAPLRTTALYSPSGSLLRKRDHQKWCLPNDKICYGWAQIL